MLLIRVYMLLFFTTGNAFLLHNSRQNVQVKRHHNVLLWSLPDEESNGEEVHNQHSRSDEQEEKNTVDPTQQVSEEEAGRQLMNRLNRINQLGYVPWAVGGSLLLVSFILRLNGYAFIVDDQNHLTIGTAEARQFRDEVKRSSRFRD